jgi:catechol 2,3-dioxygenase-like lactoylglutathione lyase family enzyme
MSRPPLDGIHHVKIPVPELPETTAWYARVFGYDEELAFRDDDGVVRGSIGTIPGMGRAAMTFRLDPAAAAGLRGFGPVSFAVPGRVDVEMWASHLDDLGIDHAPLIEAPVGRILVFHDCNGMELHVYSWERND